MYRIRKKFTFEASHVLPTAESTDCMRMHGHSYRVELYFESAHLDEHGMVVDFKVISKRVKEFLNIVDHKVFYKKEAPKGSMSAAGMVWDTNTVYMSVSPTAENMAFLFFGYFHSLGNLARVRVHETATGWAEYE